MKLDKVDRAFLECNGFSESDFEQIEKAARRTKYSLSSAANGWRYERITAKEAEKILGRKDFISGLSRSAFHWSAVRMTGTGSKVYFDSSSMFR